MASADLRKELECPVCLNIYTDPVNLKCGHNFCRGCIDRVLDSQEASGGYSCPECREEFMERPALQKNIALKNIAQSFLSTQPDQEVVGVRCTYCVDSPVPAVMSCLLCDASLCDKHLKVHSKATEHVLCDPNTSLENRKCSIHKKILEYYCTEDAACVCVSCRLDGDHRGHQVETLHEASEKKLRNDLQKIMVQTEEAEKRVHSLEELRRKAQEKADGETHRVTVLFTELRGRLDDLEKRVLRDVTSEVQRVSLLCDCVIRHLEIKKEELSRKMRHTEELCNMSDPLTILQEPDTGDMEEIEKHDEQIHDEGDLDVATISLTLHTGLSDIISGINGGVYIQPADIFLDLNTANNNLHISDDRKTVSFSLRQNCPETPERFQHPEVLSSQSFSSGRHYWEVDVGGSDRWRVGMCYPSIARKGLQSLIGNNNKSWCVRKSGDQYSVRHDSKEIPLPEKIPSDRIRIYLDHESGKISFYALCDPIRHLHTFTATFTEPLHAMLGIADGCIKIPVKNRDVRDLPTGGRTRRE